MGLDEYKLMSNATDYMHCTCCSDKVKEDKAVWWIGDWYCSDCKEKLLDEYNERSAAE